MATLHPAHLENDPRGGCPWALRAIIARQLLGLEEAVPLVATDGWWPFSRGLPALATGGWRTSAPLPQGALVGASAELRAHAEALPFYFWRLYVATGPECTGRVTVPILWDSAKAAVANNESADILGILNSAPFKSPSKPGVVDLRPKDLEKDIDELNTRLYQFNNGVYRCGFSGKKGGVLGSTGGVVSDAGLLEDRLRSRRFLFGDRLTECDVRCFTTLVRCDLAYYNAARALRQGTEVGGDIADAIFGCRAAEDALPLGSGLDSGHGGAHALPGSLCCVGAARPAACVARVLTDTDGCGEELECV